MDNRAKRKQAEIERKRQDILESSIKIFANKGFHRTKMEDVAAECGYAVGALYKYFSSKDELYIQLIHDKLDELAKVVSEAITTGPTMVDGIRAFVHSCVRFFEANQDFFRIYVNEAKGFQWNLQENVGNGAYQRYQEFLLIVEQNLKKAMEQGQLRQDVNARSAAVAMVGVVNAFFTQHVALREESDWRIDADEIFEIIICGLMPHSRQGGTT